MNGSIQPRPDRPKPWRARYRDPHGRQRSKSFTRKIDAERWLREQLAKIDQGLWIDPEAGKLTFQEWSDEWLPGLDVKPKTRAGYESVLNSRVLPTFANVELRRITPSMVRKWVAEMAADGLSASRIRQGRQLLRASLEAAVADGILGRNPTQHVKVPTDRPREQRYLTAPEVEALVVAADRIQTGAGLLIRFLAYSGVRWGEAVALRAGRIDVPQRRVTIAESATEIRGRLEFGTPKSHRTRTLVLPRLLLEPLSFKANTDDDTLVFVAPNGGPLRSSNFRKSVWMPALDSASIVPGLRIHDLRHSAASLMISAGASIKAVQKALGHASASITLDRYSHLYVEDQVALAEALDQRFGEPDVAHTWPKQDAPTWPLRSAEEQNA